MTNAKYSNIYKRDCRRKAEHTVDILVDIIKWKPPWKGSGNTVTADGVTVRVKGRKDSNCALIRLPAAGIRVFTHSGIRLFMKTNRGGGEGGATD